jgi:hypothetical protein
MDSKKTLKAKTKKQTKVSAPAAAENFLFSIPSLHTQNNDYEHLVIAPTKEEACRLLAEHRVTEKRPDLEGSARAQLVAVAVNGYSYRSVAQIEPRMEAPGVLAINHHKIGITSPSLH